MSGYIGTQPVPQATQTRDSFTATSGQTTFATGGYTPNFLDVYLNGVKLASGASADYTATNGSDVVLASGAATGDILEVVAFTTFNSASSSIDDNGNATAITIDSSGNLLVGKTSTSFSTAGFRASPSGTIQPVVNGGSTANFNRLTSDGDIVDFRKDGSNVGSIGVDAGDNLYIGSTAANHGGIYMNDSGVLPMSAGAVSDNTRSLGNPSFRWKDLYLSGGVYLGGTGSANKLDDYEEGTWSPVSVGTSVGVNGNKATYTKIGNTVIASAELNIASNSNNAQLRVSLPFTVGSVSDGGFMRYSNAGSNTPSFVVSNDNNADVVFYNSSGNAATFSSVSNKRVDFLIIYRV